MWRIPDDHVWQSAISGPSNEVHEGEAIKAAGGNCEVKVNPHLPKTQCFNRVVKGDDLQETIVFTTKYKGFLHIQFLEYPRLIKNSSIWSSKMRIDP